MHKTVLSRINSKFYCKIKAEPVLKTSDYDVYQLGDFETDIEISVRGFNIDSVRHLTIDRNSVIVHLYSMNQNNKVGRIGACDINDCTF